MSAPRNPWDRSGRPPARSRAPAPPSPSAPVEVRSAGREVRIHGLNAVRAVHARRPDAIRKLYLSQARVADLKPLLAWCAAHRVGYRIVEDGDLQ